MTALRYKIPKSKDRITMWRAASTAPDAATNDGSVRMIRADVEPAIADARTYFQAAATIEPTRSCIGLPAYQKAGIVSIQKDAVQANATPAGPRRSPRINRSPVTMNSTTPQRNQRSAFPMDRWIQPWV